MTLEEAKYRDYILNPMMRIAKELERANRLKSICPQTGRWMKKTERHSKRNSRR